MRIKRVKIKNFRTLYDVTIDYQNYYLLRNIELVIYIKQEAG